MIRLNLLPKNLRRRVEPGWWRLLALLFALVVLGVLGLVHYTAYTELSLAKAERDQLQAEVEASRPVIAELGRACQVVPLKNNAVPWSQYLAAFINQLPRAGGRLEVALRSVSARALSEEEAARLAQEGTYDGKRIRVEFALQGEALSREALVRFIRAFETSPRFGIEFQGASLDEGRGLYTFSARVGATGGESGAR